MSLTQEHATPVPNNPFLSPSTLPFAAPPFDQMREEHFLPAIEAGMAEQRAEIDAITANPEPATFANTIVPLETSGRLLARVMIAFSCLTGAHTTPALQDLSTQLAPRLAAHHDAISLDSALFARVDAVYQQRTALSLDAESLRLLETTWDGFVHHGAALDEAGKQRLRAINEELSTLCTRFANMLLDLGRETLFRTEDVADLDGLSAAQLAAAQELAQSRGWQGWALTLTNTTQQPVLESLKRRSTRQAIFELSWNRASAGSTFDSRERIARIAQLRAESATLLGFASYAAWKLHDQMAKTAENVSSFLAGLAEKARGWLVAEAADLQAMIDAECAANGTPRFELAAWDWPYYAERLRSERYALDESLLKPYFELNNVVERGVFLAATRLYGITFQLRTDLPVYHPSVRVYEVRNPSGEAFALFYSDPFKRPSKRGGAWMSSLVYQTRLLGMKPVIYNVENIEEPAEGHPALLTLDEVRTLFHEFGHALHGLFSDANYASLAGTAVPRDFVEFPSQFNEYWATHPEILPHYARHHQTGDPIPHELAERLRRAKDFNRGYRLSEVVAASIIDMRWHTLPHGAPLQDADALEAAALDAARLDLPYLRPRYRSTYFAHIFYLSYAAGYYAYQWAETLENEAIAWFESHGGITRQNGDWLRSTILSRGNTADLATQFSTWLAGPPA
ncbi:MAG: M3 family metallopeptidase [Acidobacteriota bacterium]|nr:M3 family metallopeptidase [Acidobacteriota bacterium]